MSRFCKVCEVEINPRRVALGYKDTCPEHSTASRYVGLVVAEGKTDYEVQILRDPETIRDVYRLSSYRGVSGGEIFS